MVSVCFTENLSILVSAHKGGTRWLNLTALCTQFNFLIDLGTGLGHGPHAGFQECSRVEKLKGLNKSTDVIVKRGVVSASDLQDWLDQIRKGDKKADRTVTIMLQDEEHKIVQTWKLLRARITKHTSGPLNARTGTWR